jgi:hypothetical protein
MAKRGKVKDVFKRKLQTALVLLTAVLMLTLFQPVTIASPAGYLLWKRDVLINITQSPYGGYNCLVSMYKLMDDGVENYDWFYYFLSIQTVPGRVKYGNEWCTDKHNAWQRLWWYGTPNEDIVDYGPTTTSGTTGQSITFTVGATMTKGGPAIGASVGVTISYSISDVIVRDHSDINPSEDRVEWEHELTDFAEVSKNTYLAKPAFVVKDDGAYCFCDGKYNVTFCRQCTAWIYISGLPIPVTWTDRATLTSNLTYLDCPP